MVLQPQNGSTVHLTAKQMVLQPQNGSTVHLTGKQMVLQPQNGSTSDSQANGAAATKRQYI